MSPDFDGPRRDEHVARRGDDGGRPLTLHSLSRSSNDAAMPEVIASARRRRASRRRRARGEAQLQRLAPDLDSPALAAARASYERLFGEEPIVTAVHAGLETAVIGDKVRGLDMLVVRPADRGAALARRARQHPDRRALLAAARRRSSTSSPSRRE